MCSFLYSKASCILQLAFFMKKIGLISDTHSYMGEDILQHLRDCDEVWHAGDIGDISVVDQISGDVPLKAVYGNIDDHKVRATFPLDQIFECEGVKIYMTHIGGYPPRYTKRVKQILLQEKPDLYICGHSHICKVLKDNKLGLLHMNPGACGHSGFHGMRTLLLFDCANGKIENLKLVELGRRGRN